MSLDRCWRTAVGGLAGLALLAIVWLSYGEWRRYSRANAEAAQIAAAVDSTDQLLFSLIDAEAGQRGYLFTGQDQYLAPYDQALRTIPNELAVMRSRLSRQPGEAESAARLDELARQKLAELQRSLDLRRAGNAAQAMALVSTDEGKRTMDAIRATVKDVQAREKARQRQTSQDGQTAAEETLLATALAAMGLLFLFAVWLGLGIEIPARHYRWSGAARYGAAVAAAVAALLLRMALTPVIGPTELDFAIALPAVLLTGWLGGLGPGIVCVLLSSFASAYYFLEPLGSFLISNRADQISFVIFIVLGLGVVMLGDSQRRAVERAGRAEAAERVERERFETTLRSIGDAVLATDAEGRITFANPVALQLLRCPEQDLAGKPLEEAFRIANEESRAPVESPVRRALQEGAIVGLANHTVLIAKDGTETPIDDSAAPIRGADGAIQGAVLVFRDITERRRAEAARRLLASIVESSADAIFSLDLRGAITSWNNGAERIFGYRAGEAIGRPEKMLASAGTENEMPALLERVTRGERIEHHRTMRRTKAGKPIYASVTLSPLFDGAGKITGASKIVRDITAEVEAQREVAEQRERLRVTLGSIGDAVLTTDAAGRVSYLNPVAERLTGWSSEDASRQPLEQVFRIINEDSRQTEDNPAARVLREGKIVGLANHTLLLSRDGREIAIDDSAAPIRDAHGEVVGVVLVFRDVTDRRAAEKLMAEQAAELRQRAALLDSVHCFVRDLEDRIVYWNAFDRAMYGYSAAEATGQVSHDLLKTVFPEARERIRQRLFETGEWDGELLHTRRDGSRVMVASHLALHRDEAGRPVSILETNMDITERLELMAKERALESEKALREAEAELARVLRALSVNELASSIAHEVNQPLAGVVINAEAGLRWLNAPAPDLEEAKASLSLIVRDGNRASAVIRRIREFLKKGQPEPVLMDVNEVIQDAVALTRGELAKRRIELRTRLADDLPRVSGDRIQLQQVILNLTLNAVEAMANTLEPRELTLFTERAAEGDVLIAVRDRGIGIHPQDMPRVFEAFFTTKPAGMGMGLSICRSIVQAHGGRIWVEANQDAGITVRFTLPAEKAGQAVSAACERA